ncbi:hypothetical protein VE03_04654 [Pseudogymnoascus sp. 23342-1-I1]|nr:hypothetical protein VE03_04654 [Pseudogymnoascus sp. 23342-1-I1]
MAINLPSFKSVRLRHKEPKPEGGNGVATDDASPPVTKAPSLKDGQVQLSKARKWVTILACVLLFIGFIFLILILTAQTSLKPVLKSTWFIKIDLSNILVRSTTPGSEFPLLNSIARSLGLHDFYLVGLWNYCEGYNDEGITNCSKPVSLYYFNPVKILLSELLAGATITLPSDILTILRLIQIASNAMFLLFLLGIIFTFLSLLLSPLSLLRSPHFSPRQRSCWVGCGLGLISFLAAFCTIVAAVVGTVMFTIMRNVLKSQPMLNIGAELGVQMLAFMWVAAGSVLFAFVMQVRCCCCCRGGRREKKAARRREREMGRGEKGPGLLENLRRRGRVSEA